MCPAKSILPISIVVTKLFLNNERYVIVKSLSSRRTKKSLYRTHSYLINGYGPWVETKYDEEKLSGVLNLDPGTIWARILLKI